MTFSLILAAAASLLMQQGSGVPDDPAAVQLPDVVVEGAARPVEETARVFSREVGAAIGDQTLARWHDPVCVSVANLKPELAQFMIDRIAGETAALGLPVGQPGCVANVVVLATHDGRDAATRMVRDRPLDFRPIPGGASWSMERLNRFQSSDAAVRWWPVSLPVANDTGEIAVRGNDRDPPIIADRENSRIAAKVRSDLQWVIVIIDVSKATGASFAALSDYVAMTVLAQVDPEADMTGQDTVLNLFAAPGAVDGLTDWDRAYLSALYSTRTGRPSLVGQQQDLARRMVRDRREAEATPSTDRR